MSSAISHKERVRRAFAFEEADPVCLIGDIYSLLAQRCIQEIH